MSRWMLAAALLFVITGAQAQAVKIVGIGASSCIRFKQDVSETPSVEKDYFAWAQGFMSGALFRAPPGVDEDLDLTPPSFPLESQADFLSKFCADHPDQDYLDATRALYHRLRGPKT